MITGILLSVGVIIVILVVIVALQPASFRIARSTTMSAPPSAIFAQVNDFHHWNSWSPWAKLDPAMKQTYGGPPAGVGAISTWVGNKKVGEGRMTLTESRANEWVKIKLEFFKPFKATNVAEFSFEDQGGQTLVTWAMTGQKNFAAKAFHLIMNMDKMLGGDFDKGLSQLKSVVESASQE
jgi:hypothetical protein